MLAPRPEWKVADSVVGGLTNSGLQGVVRDGGRLRLGLVLDAHFLLLPCRPWHALIAFHYGDLLL